MAVKHLTPAERDHVIAGYHSLARAALKATRETQDVDQRAWLQSIYDHWTAEAKRVAREWAPCCPGHGTVSV